ncbi:PhnA-like protein [Chenggangzhangella methanolivorans]
MTDIPMAGTATGPIAHSASVERTAAFNQISWGAVFAGVVLALTVQFLLNLLGVGIGAAAIDPGASDNPGAGAASIFGGLWYVVAGLIGAFAGGYVSSRLSGRPSTSTGSFHGLVTWAVTALVVLYLLTTSVGALVGGAFSGLSGAIGGVGRAASTAAQAAAPSLANMNPMADLDRQVRETSGSDPAALQAGAVAAMQAVVSGDPSKMAEAKDRAAVALAKARNIPVEQARIQVDDYEAKYRQTVAQAKQKATEAAVTATKVVSRGALLGFVALLLGAVAAWFGGAAGTSRATAALVSSSATARPRA